MIWLLIAALFAVGVSGWVFWPRIAPLLQRRPKPEKHEGATEKFGAELHALKDAPVAPELVSDVERELEWAVRWHDLEHALQEQIDRIFTPVLNALEEPRSFPELYELVFPEQVNENTGEWKLVSV